MNDKSRASYVRLAPDNRRAALIHAARTCIAEGGIAAFNVDQVCAQAGVSRGLVTHHFGSMNALLASVYQHAHAVSMPVLADLPRDWPLILSVLDHLFAPGIFNRQSLNVWLTLWARISNHPDLRDIHRTHYRAYHQMIAAALHEAGLGVQQAGTLAQSLTCLIDGLGLQHCIDPESMPSQVARQSCTALLAHHIPTLADPVIQSVSRLTGINLI